MSIVMVKSFSIYFDEHAVEKNITLYKRYPVLFMEADYEYSAVPYFNISNDLLKWQRVRADRSGLHLEIDKEPS